MIHINKNNIINISKDLLEILSTEENLTDGKKVFKQINNYLLDLAKQDKTFSLEFRRNNNEPPVLIIYEWNYQHVETQLKATVCSEYEINEKIHQIKNNNRELIGWFLVDLFFLKKHKNHQLHQLFILRMQPDQQENNTYSNREDYHKLYNYIILIKLMQFCLFSIQNNS
jgi:hypothetical protein